MSARHRPAGKSRGLLAALAGVVVVIAAAAVFVAYALWPTWPTEPTALDAPTIPVTIAGVLFNVPPATIREAVQRHPGRHDRIDLSFVAVALAAAAGQ